jgi:hypothetical protein
LHRIHRHGLLVRLPLLISLHPLNYAARCGSDITEIHDMTSLL